MNYDISHLTQDSTQYVLGPIQDDEALLLFALCKSMLIRNVVEVGTQAGYSTRNFIKAVGEKGFVISIDICEFNYKYPNFKFLQKDVGAVEAYEIPWEIDLIFFDSHAIDAQLIFYEKLSLANKINNNTIIVVHDTNLHSHSFSPGEKIDEGWMHQPGERRFVNNLIEKGWIPFHIHTKLDRHSSELPFRHGLTLLSKKNYLKT